MIKNKKKIVIIGFDHNILDKRIVLKDLISLSKKFEHIIYITRYYKEDNIHLEKFNELLPNVNLQRIKKEEQGIIARYNFEKTFYLQTLEFQPDIIYIHGSFLFYPFGLYRIKKELKNVSIISDIHEFEPDFFMKKKFILSFLIFNFYKFLYIINSNVTDNTFCATPHIKLFLEKYNYTNIYLKLNMPTKDVEQKYNFKDKLNFKIFVVTGGIVRDRGVHYVIQIISQLNCDLQEKYKLVLYGKFLDKIYEKECLELAVKNNVEFIDKGFLFYDTLLVEMQKSTFVFHDLEKPLTLQGKYALSNKIFDATACGTPLICQDDDEGIESMDLNYNIALNINIYEDFPYKASKQIADLLQNEIKYAEICRNTLKFKNENNWALYENQFLEKFGI